MFDRVLIIGASGQLGSALAHVFADRAPLMPSHAEVDITCSDMLVEMIERVRPTLLINTAAFHNVPLCEEHPENAFAVNALATDALARICARVGAFFTHVSTDYVFDGLKNDPYDETDACAPLNAYGASKLAGEHLIARHGGDFLIVRTSGLYAFAGPSSLKGLPFIEKILRQAERGDTLHVVDDVVFSPSYAPHVARAVRTLLERRATGVVHVSNAGQTSWHGFALAALEEAGISAAIDPIVANDAPVRRPRYSAFSLRKLIALTGETPPSWREGVRAYIAARHIARPANPSAGSLLLRA